MSSRLPGGRVLKGKGLYSLGTSSEAAGAEGVVWPVLGELGQGDCALDVNDRPRPEPGRAAWLCPRTGSLGGSSVCW